MRQACPACTEGREDLRPDRVLAGPSPRFTSARQPAVHRHGPTSVRRGTSPSARDGDLVVRRSGDANGRSDGAPARSHREYPRAQPCLHFQPGVLAHGCASLLASGPASRLRRCRGRSTERLEIADCRADVIPGRAVRSTSTATWRSDHVAGHAEVVGWDLRPGGSMGGIVAVYVAGNPGKSRTRHVAVPWR